MTIEETRRAILGVVDRASRYASMHGEAFICVTYDAQHEQLLFGIIPPEYVKVSYDDQG